VTTTKQEYQQKIVNSIVFKTKIISRNTIDSMNNITLDEVIFHYIDIMEVPTTIQQCHNQITWFRKYSMALIKKLFEHSDYLNKIQDKYKKFIKDTGVTNISDFSPQQYDLYESYLKTINHYQGTEKMLEDMIIRYSYKLADICDIYDKENLDFHSFCQILNMNPISVKQNILGELKDRKHYHYIFRGIENDGSNPEWKQNKSNDMPLFNLLHEALILFMGRNKGLKDKMSDFFLHDMGFAEHAMVIKEDADGNKTLEKYYHPLRVVE